MPPTQAESVIKNIIREIGQECAAHGEIVPETLVAFMVRINIFVNYCFIKKIFFAVQGVRCTTPRAPLTQTRESGSSPTSSDTKEKNLPLPPTSTASKMPFLCSLPCFLAWGPGTAEPFTPTKGRSLDLLASPAQTRGPH